MGYSLLFIIFVLVVAAIIFVPDMFDNDHE